MSSIRFDAMHSILPVNYPGTKKSKFLNFFLTTIVSQFVPIYSEFERFPGTRN